MDEKYTPQKCCASNMIYGIYICRLQASPCALHKGEKCYMQKADDAAKLILDSETVASKEMLNER